MRLRRKVVDLPVQASHLLSTENVTNRTKGWYSPDSLWPSSKSLTIRFFLRAWRSALISASITMLTRLASDSLDNLSWDCSGVSFGGGLRTSSNGSSDTGMSVSDMWRLRVGRKGCLFSGTWLDLYTCSVTKSNQLTVPGRRHRGLIRNTFKKIGSSRNQSCTSSRPPSLVRGPRAICYRQAGGGSGTWSSVFGYNLLVTIIPKMKVRIARWALRLPENNNTLLNWYLSRPR